jgi:hypothetical protein
MALDIFSIDFETFFADKRPHNGAQYTLKKMTTESYVRDPRFQAHCLGVYSPKTQVVLPRDAIPGWLARVDWSKTAIICHHAQFDAFILAHHYGVRPAMILDTLALSRAVRGVKERHSLASVAAALGLDQKTMPYNELDGYRWEELPPRLRQSQADGCMRDCEITFKAADKLVSQVPPAQLRLIDATIRMFTEGWLVGDRARLATLVEVEHQRKQAALTACGVTDSVLKSDVQFQALLERLGVEIEYKMGGGANPKLKPCFAKTDDFMISLSECGDETLEAIAQARMLMRSTIQETRAGRLLSMATRGSLTPYYYYYGAVTSRWASGDSCNFQNMPSRGRNGTELKECIQAPPGYALVISDAAQIEARMLATVAGQFDKVQAFRQGRDLYCEFSSRLYGREITKKDVLERTVGKVSILQCLGPDTLVLTPRGYIPITQVRKTDKVWDSESWVSHEGLLERGSKECGRLAGIWMTPDHRVLCGETWMDGRHVDAPALSRALERGSASLPSRAMNWARKAACKRLWSNAVAAARSTPLTFITSFWERRRGATVARLRRRERRGGSIGAMRILSRIRTCVIEQSRACQHVLDDVITQMIRTTTITAGGESTYGKDGGAISAPLCNTSWGFLDGTTERLNLIGKTITQGMFQVIYDLLRVWKTSTTEDGFKTSNRKMPTYDLALTGSNNRFTILSCAGPIIVHNCGYGSGHEKFVKTVEKNTGGKLILPPQEGKRIVGFYRDDNLAICGHRVGKNLTGGLWQKGDEWLEILARGLSADYWAPEEPGQPHSGQPLLRFRDHKLLFPGGGMLHYDGMYFGVHPSAKDDNGERPGWLLPKRKGVERMYGAHMVQHVIQGLSTGCHGHFGEVVLRVNDRLRGWGRVCLITHDDLGAAVREERQEEAAAAIGEEMSRAPWWLPNAPLAADVQIRRDYAKQ